MQYDREWLVNTLMQELKQQTAVGHFPQEHLKVIYELIENWVDEHVEPMTDPYAEIRQRVRQRIGY